MKKTASRIFYYIQLILCAATCFFGITALFISSNSLSSILANTLDLKITPSFTGGPVVKDFYDDTGDDKGSGILLYPENTAFENGSLDLIRYTVHKPVYEARWQAFPEYWQLGLEYKKGSAEVRNIMIYIDIDDDKKGCFETLSENAENIQFDSEHPWDFAVWICEGKSKVYDSTKTFITNAQTSIRKNDREILIRIPLQNKELQRIYTSQKTYHYVLTGAFSKFDNGGFMPVENKKSISRGSTENPSDYNDFISPVYDILGNNNQLNTRDEENLFRATLHPVEADMKAANLKQSKSSINEDAAFISEVKAKIAAEHSSDSSETDSYFGYETLDEAENNFYQQIKDNPDDAKALAYYASCIAMKGGQSSIMQAVDLVNKSFEYFNRAAENTTPENEYEVHLNMASVFTAVPNAVFGKTEDGAKEFIKCAEISKRLYPENPEIAAYHYICAANAFLSLGKNSEYYLSIQEAKKIMYNRSVEEH